MFMERTRCICFLFDINHLHALCLHVIGSNDTYYVRVIPAYDVGRGGSDGCAVPMNIERLNTLGVVQVECGAQFSLALTRDGEVRSYILQRFRFFCINKLLDKFYADQGNKHG